MKLYMFSLIFIQFALRFGLGVWVGHGLKFNSSTTGINSWERMSPRLLFTTTSSPDPSLPYQPKVKSVDCGFILRASKPTTISNKETLTRRNASLQMPPFSISRALKMSTGSTFEPKSTRAYKCWRALSIVEIRFADPSNETEAMVEFSIHTQSLINITDAKLTFVLSRVRSAAATSTTDHDGTTIQIAGFIKENNQSQSVTQLKNYKRKKVDVSLKSEQVDCNVLQLLQEARIKLLQREGKDAIITVAFFIHRRCDHETTCSTVLNQGLHKPSLRLFYI